MSSTAVILAAGHGTRMRSALPKALHALAGRPMLAHLLEQARHAFDTVVLVVGPDMADVAALNAPGPVVVQSERLGTAHAALQAAPCFGAGPVAVLYADNPLIRAGTMGALLAQVQHGSTLGLLAMRPPDPARYGRVIEHAGRVARIVEWAVATRAERDVGLCNAGVVCGPGPAMARWLAAVPADTTTGEHFLGGVIPLAAADGVPTVAVEAPWQELQGINSRAELAAAEAFVQTLLRQAAMEGGATLVAPETVFLAWDTRLATDVTVHPHVVFGPGVDVAAGAEIRSFSHLEGAQVGPGAVVGPFARLRPGAALEAGSHAGNFVELKNTVLGAGAKANHLTYLGDATVGAGTNVGAGTITCNYDGFAKHRTTIGDGAFIGSHTTMVAPVHIGAGAITAAGSTITDDVPADAMAFGRARQQQKPGRAAAYRAARRRKD